MHPYWVRPLLHFVATVQVRPTSRTEVNPSPCVTNVFFFGVSIYFVVGSDTRKTDLSFILASFIILPATTPSPPPPVLMFREKLIEV